MASEREHIRGLLKLMLDVSWGEQHGDHSEGCEQCDLASIWFKLAQLLLDYVYPEGGPFPEEETLNSIAYGALGQVSRSNTATSFKSSGTHSHHLSFEGIVTTYIFLHFSCLFEHFNYIDLMQIWRLLISIN